MRLTTRLAGIVPPATLTLAQKARDLEAQGRDVVNLTVGEPDFDTPPHVVEAIHRALQDGQTKYTAINGILSLREAIARRYLQEGVSYDPAEIIVATGAKQCVFNAVLCLIQEGDEAIVPTPAWLSYGDMVKFAGGSVVEVATTEESAFLMSPEELERAITPRTRLLFLNSPANPTGALYDRKGWRALADVLARHPEITVIADEIYDCFVYGDRDYCSILKAAPDLEGRVLQVNGCSKRYAMTGLRLGWAAGPRALISAMGRIQGQSTSNACSAVQYGALAALEGDQSFVGEMSQAFDVRRRFVIGRLDGIPHLTCFDPRGAFYVLPNVSRYVGRALPDGSTVGDGFSIAAHLLHEHALVVVPGGPFGAKNHIRLSFASDMDTLAKGLDRLRSALLALG
jgi:aspartate aminotransferase